MKFLKLKRAVGDGWISFRRNAWLTVATVGVLTLSLFILGSTFLIGIGANELIKNIEKNVNISIYFKNDIDEDRIMEIKEKIEKKLEVETVEYISKEMALEKFSKDNQDNEIIKNALSEIAENPLFSSLVLTAKDQIYYEDLVNFIENDFKNEVDRINYRKNKSAIDQLGKIVATTQRIGLTSGFIFAIISILVTFSAIRVSLFARKNEFDIMRLVGASNLYVKIPIIFEGIYYGFFAAIIAVIIITVVAYGGISLLGEVLPKNEMIHFYLKSFWKIGGLVLLAGLSIGALSSVISIRKYLKI